MNFPQHRPLKAWQEAVIPSLGKRTDADLAKEHNVTERQVRYLRERLKIEPVCKTRWRGSVAKRLGVVKDKVLAAELDVSVEAVIRQRHKRELKYERRGIPPEAIARLGKVSDAEMAREFGRSQSTVMRWRHERGIPAKPAPRRAWERSELALLGTMPDPVVGKLLLRNVDSVRRKRESLEIPAYAPGQEVTQPGAEGK